MTIDTVLFDFDGTLADTLPICFYSFKEVFYRFDNKILNEDDIVSMFGPSEVGIIEQNLDKKENFKQAIESYYQFYSEMHSKLVRSDSEIVNMLDQLKLRNMKLGIVTGKARRSLELSMNELNLNHYFDISIAGDDVVCPKPDPEGIIKAMSILESDKERTIFIGDSQADIQAGKSAGVLTIGVSWLSHIQTSNIEEQPDYYFSEIKQLIDFIDKNT